MNYRKSLLAYLTQHNLTAREFADWSGLPLTAINNYSPKHESEVFEWLERQHPLSTPAIPVDLADRVDQFRVVSALGWRELSARWSVPTTSLLGWAQGKRPSVKNWRSFCARAVKVVSPGYGSVHFTRPREGWMPARLFFRVGGRRERMDCGETNPGSPALCYF